MIRTAVGHDGLAGENMMKLYTTLKFTAGHVLAGSVVILGTLATAFVCYVIGIAMAPGGFATPAAEIPFVLALLFFSGLIGLIVAITSFLISAFLTWLRSKRSFPVWLPVLVIPLLAFVVVLLIFGSSKGIDFVWMMTGLAFVYFGIYWTLVTSCGALMDFLRRKLSKPTEIGGQASPSG